MPTVKFEKFLVIKEFLDPDYGPYLPYTRQEKISSIYHEESVVESFTAVLLDEEVRQNECNNIVNYGPYIKLHLNTRHQLLFKVIDFRRIVLESESFMLVMD